MTKTFTLFFCFLFIIPIAVSSQVLTYQEQVWDFGHVGIDFKVFHTFQFKNTTNVPIKIKDIEVSCDCTSVHAVDSVVQPGATGSFDLTFTTKDYYGPTNKSFKVFTDYPQNPVIEFYYVSIVGQWYNGLKPDPISIFFLPGKKSEILKIPNKEFDEISVDNFAKYNDVFDVRTIENSAGRGNDIQLEISPATDLEPGTYHSTLTLSVKNDKDEKLRMSIPIKIVKY